MTSAALLLLAVGSASAVYLQDLFHALDPRLPHGYYRIPSMVATNNGTLLAFVMGRFHRTDSTPNIVYLRRSHDDGNTWESAQPILAIILRAVLCAALLAVRRGATRPA